MRNFLRWMVGGWLIFLFCFSNSLAKHNVEKKLSVTEKQVIQHSQSSSSHCKKKQKIETMDDDRLHYEEWCKHHPGQCSKKLKMFDSPSE